MEEQKAVETLAEQPVETESAPVEEQSTEPSIETPQTPADASIEPEQEEKVSRTVPYERFKEINDKYKTLEEMVAPIIQAQNAQPQQSAMSNEIPQLDDDSTQAVRALINKEWENKKAEEFVRKHMDDLKDPVLTGTIQRVIAEANAKNEYIDQEDALAQAKKLLDERIKPQVQKAQTEGVEEGQEVARKKQQAGAIGDNSQGKTKVEPDKLSAKEFAEYYGLKYGE